jgi:hypothetical protein
MRAWKTSGLHGIVLCSSLIAVPRLCLPQTMQSAAEKLPDAPSVTASMRGDTVLRIAAEPADLMAGDAVLVDPQQTNQEAKPADQQDQKKPAPEPSLGDLGFTAQQTQADARMQAMLNKRTHMLKVHQTLGLITAIPMAATLITGPQAKAKGKNGQPITEPTQANLDFHIALGGLTTAMYFTTAYYSMFAPTIPGVKPKGAIRLHRSLEWVHGPGMIITPILGIMAYKQENAGEKTHGAASYHGTAAYVTAAAYGASIVAVSWPIHWKFWEKK